MRQSKRYRSPDNLEFFFKDVAQYAIIGGKSEYLPLTRRIERGRILAELLDQNVEITVQHIQDALHNQLDRLSVLLTAETLSKFLEHASKDAESFLDRSDCQQPPSLAQLSNPQQPFNDENAMLVRQSGWTCTALISLFPLHLRDQWNNVSDLESMAIHFKAIQEEYSASKQRLIEGTLRYAIRLARFYVYSGVPYLDLVQEGYLGIIHAIDKFQEVAGAHFQSYTANWIQQRIRRYISDHARLIRIPVHQYEKVPAMDEAIAKLWEQFGRQPSNDELFLELGWLNDEDLWIINTLKKYKQHRQISEKLERHRRLLTYRDKPLSEIPPQLHSKIILLEDGYSSLEEQTTSFDDIDVFYHLGWLNQAEVRLLRNPPRKILPQQASQPLDRLKKARSQLAYYQMINAKHYSLEQPLYTSSERLFWEDILAAPNDVEATSDSHLLRIALLEQLDRLNEREKEIINLRFGLIDGEERTLEEVGEVFGVTRERIRQIESKAIKKLHRPTEGHNKIKNLAENTGSGRDTDHLAELAVHEVLREIHYTETLMHAAITEKKARETHLLKSRIEESIKRFIMQGRIRNRSKGMIGLRAHVFRQILERHQQPMHYRAIHEESLKLLPPAQHSSEKTSYAALFQSDLFQLLGEGVFGLAEWEYTTTTTTGKRVLQHCPQPLLPENANLRSFFESIMVGKDLLKRIPQLTAQNFYMEMLGWAQKNDNNWLNMQSAFDAWYAAGLIERVDIANSNGAYIQLTLAPDARLNDVRQHCLNSLCRRILKMSELLLTLKRIARPTLSDIQKVLFGTERAGFDVPARLNILAAFEAVQRAGDEWRLTAVGEETLRLNPPEELPDFDAIEEVTAELVDDDDDDELIWQDELGLLEL